MNVRCQSCGTVYRVDPVKVPDGGIRARCTICSAIVPLSPEGVEVAAPTPQPAAGAPAPPPAAEPVVAAAPAPEPVLPEPGPVPSIPEPVIPTAPAAADAITTGPRLSRPFAHPQPSRQAVAPPRRPSAPVFRPTPGQPVQPAAPVAPAPTPGPEPIAPAAPPPTPTPEPVAPVSTVAAAPAAPAAPVAPAVPAAPVVKKPINPFLAQDPRQKARRLSRALISDMIVYQPGKRQRSLAVGTLKEDFADEIQKSWEEYVAQVGQEMAASTDFWTEALNDILAGGQKLF